MRARRLIGSAVAAALATTTLGLISAAAPASAATVVTTQVVVNLSQSKAHYGDKVTLSGAVQGQTSDGQWGTLPTSSGPINLLFLPKGSGTWQTLQTDEDGGYFSFSSVPVTKSGTFRVAYAGGTYNDYQFNPSVADKAIKGFRNLRDKKVSHGQKFFIKGNVNPKAGKVFVERKLSKHGKWKRFTKVRTKKGKFTVRLPLPARGHRWYFRAYVPAAGGLEKSFSNYVYYTYRY